MAQDEKRIIPPEDRSTEYMAGWDFADGLVQGGHDITRQEPPAEWPAETRKGFRMRALQAQTPNNVQALVPPEGCTTEFAEGWEAAEEWIRYGEPVTVEHLHPEVMPGGMTAGQTSGFRARILKELEPDSGQMLAFKPRQQSSY